MISLKIEFYHQTFDYTSLQSNIYNRVVASYIMLMHFRAM